MSLEKNIERIAEALEVIAGMKGVKTDTAAVSQTGQMQQAPQSSWQAQTQQNSGQAQQMPPAPAQGNRIPVSLPAGTAMQWQGNGGSAGIPVNSAPQSPAPQFQQPGNSGQVPTTATAQPYTFDQLAVATANLASSGKDVFAVLGRFGVNVLMDLPPEKYGEYAAALREAGAVI